MEYKILLEKVVRVVESVDRKLSYFYEDFKNSEVLRAA